MKFNSAHRYSKVNIGLFNLSVIKNLKIKLLVLHRKYTLPDVRRILPNKDPISKIESTRISNEQDYKRTKSNLAQSQILHSQINDIKVNQFIENLSRNNSNLRKSIKFGYSKEKMLFMENKTLPIKHSFSVKRSNKLKKFRKHFDTHFLITLNVSFRIMEKTNINYR